MTAPRTRSKIAATIAVVLTCGWLTLAACADSAEGDRCEILNNSSDCQSPLVCTATSVGERCCPADRKTATDAVCMVVQAPSTETPPLDSGPAADTGSDTGGQTPSDAGAGADAADAGDANELDAADAAG